MIKHLLKMSSEHDSMEEFHTDKFNSMDDGHEMKSVHSRLAKHHALMSKLCKAAASDVAIGGSSDIHVGDLHGPSKARGANDIVNDGVKLMSVIDPPQVHMIPRAGSSQSLDKAVVDAPLEEMFRI